MPYKSGFKDVYYIGEEELEKMTGLKTKTEKPVIYSELIQQYNKDNQFVDTDFPTDDSSVDAKKLGFDEAQGLNFPDWDFLVIWKRPQEALALHNKTNLFGDQPQVDEIKYVFSQASVKDRAAKSRFDITQGRVGDCWMVAALSQVTQKAEIIDFVVPDDNLNNNDSGVYHFRFHYFGYWVDVVIDDYLPLFEENGPGTGYNILICTPPHENGVYEIWPLLAEKAYAKLQGTIQQLDGGFSLIALEDLTGGIGEYISLNDGSIQSSQLFEMLMRLNKQCFVSLGTGKEERMGLAGGHAYSVTSLTTVTYEGKEIELLRVRNPWGKGEWNGAWSDSSTEFNSLSEEDRKKVGLVIENDGEFWISAKDAAMYFDSVEACYWFPEKIIPVLAKSFDIHTFHSQFKEDNYNLDEPWNGPQFVTEVKGGSGEEDCAILANVTLKCKMQDREGSLAIKCFKILNPDNWPENKFSEAFFTSASQSKEYRPPGSDQGLQSFEQRLTVGFKVPAGKYVIVPGLMGLKYDYGFLLRLAGQLVPTEEASSMAKQVELAGDVNTDTGVARKDPNSETGGDSNADIEDNWMDKLNDGTLDPSTLSDEDRKLYESLQGYQDQSVRLAPTFLFE